MEMNNSFKSGYELTININKKNISREATEAAPMMILEIPM